MPGGGGLPYETDGDARRLAQGYKFWILVSLRVFRAKHQYFKLPKSRLGFCAETRNYAKRKRSQIFFFLLFQQSLLGVKFCLRHAQIGLLQGLNSKFPTSIPVCSILESPPGCPWSQLGCFHFVPKEPLLCKKLFSFHLSVLHSFVHKIYLVAG